MTSKRILETKDSAVDNDIQISDDGKKLEVYLETWFDVEKKFHVRLEEDEWINLYAAWNPKTNRLKMVYVIATPDGSTEHKYRPTRKEKQVVIDKIKEKINWKINNVCKNTPLEFFGRVI